MKHSSPRAANTSWSGDTTNSSGETTTNDESTTDATTTNDEVTTGATTTVTTSSATTTTAETTTASADQTTAGNGVETGDRPETTTQPQTETATTTTQTATPTQATTQSQTTTGVSTTTNAPTQTEGDASSVLDVSNTELQTSETETALTGEVTNTGSQRLAYVEVTARFRNDAGDILDTTPTNIAGLDAGTTWEVYAPYLGTDDEATDGEIEVTDSTPGEIPPPPDGIELVEDSLEQPDDEFSGPSVVGRAKNNTEGSVSYLEAAATFYADNGNALGSGLTNVTDLPADETWRFDIEFTSYNTDDGQRVADYDVYLTDSSF